MGVLFVLVYWHDPRLTSIVMTVIFVGLLSVGLLIDLDHKIIPDKITLVGIVSGLVLASFSPRLGVVQALLGVLLCGGVLYASGWLTETICHRHQVMGGGDIKFAGMIGAFLGWQQGIMAIVAASFVGTLFGLFQVARYSGLPESREVRFGPFLALGAVTALFWKGIVF